MKPTLRLVGPLTIGLVTLLQVGHVAGLAEVTASNMGNDRADNTAAEDTEGYAIATTFTVNSTDDVDDGTCDATHCSLRESINAANANAGTDTIAFSIPGAGPHTIQPGFALPTITDPVVIDGTTEPDFAGTPIIELDGTNAGNVHGLEITTANSTLRGLVINRFLLNGVLITGAGANGNLVEGNFIGTDVSGAVALSNGGDGVFIEDAPNNTIGGTTAGARNVISGNAVNGVSMNGSGATGNLVQGNYIGTDVNGTAAIGNGNAGVLVGNATNNTIGGTTAGARNVISGNLEGVTIVDLGGPGASGNVVQGNYIGTDVTGTSAIGNVAGFLLLASGNTIGGTSAGAGNTIAFNDGPGVNHASGTGNAILSNSIFSNAELGIDLADGGGAQGVTANDAGDGDTGANNLQNFPVLISVFEGSTTIEGTLNSTPSTTFTLELFSNSACDPSGFGEGESFVGSTMVTTDAGGDASFMVTFPATSPTGTLITATATDPSNNTSEFSRCATVGADFTVAVSPDSVTVIRGEAATYTVIVSPQGGIFGGDVSLSCSGLPAQASCSFSPSTVSPGGSAVTSTLTVSTTVPATPTGSFTITGTSGSLQRFTTATLVVTTDFTIAVSPASVTVIRGEAATYTVTVSPEGGSFDEVVSLSCSGLPTLTSCSFSPSAVMPGASAVTSTLSVSTTGPSALLAPPLGQQHGAPTYALWLRLLALGLPGVVLVGVALGGRASKRRRLGLYWPLALVLLAALTLTAGCGDDGVITSPTPTGTFTFTITGTSGSLEHSAMATVVVQ